METTNSMLKENSIKCPSCGSVIDVSDVLYHQAYEKIRAEFQIESASKDQEIEKKLKALQTEQEKVEKEKSELTETISSQVNEKLKLEKSNLEATIKKRFAKE